jgi:hypothetical protein
MAVLKPRGRLVYFRISEDEFRQFAGACEREGARSISDLARNAVQRVIADGHRQREDEHLAQRMHRLDELIAAVTEQLQLLAAVRRQDPSMIDLAMSADGCSLLRSLGNQQNPGEE